MRVIIEKNYEELSRWAARHVVETINVFQPTAEKPFVLGLPTGSSPMGMYAEIVKAVKAGEVSFKHVLTFNMDEYVGLPESHPESYHSFMANNLFNHIDCPKENIHILNGNAENLEEECKNYEKMIEEVGGINLFIGGIGPDGHIPSTALTVGVGTVMAAKEVMILCNGHNKARALHAAIEGPVTQEWTISALQLHQHGIIVCDELATDELKVGTYRYFKDIEKDNL